MITVLAHGSRGDVQPFIALALGLQRAGHAVRLVANADFEALARSHGLAFRPLPFGIQSLLETDAGQAMIHSGRLWDALLYFLRETSRYTMQIQLDSWQACQDTDVLVYSFISLWGYDIAEKLGAVGAPALLIPAYPTRAFPVPQGTIPNLGGVFNRTTHWLLLALVWQMLYRGALTRFRQEVLHLAGAPGILQRLNIPQLHAYSPLVVPRPADWPAWVHQTGYWFLPAPDDWKPPSALSAFLEAGDPPVYIGFGSMANRSAAEMTRLVLEALRQTGQRAVLARGWGGLAGEQLPKTVFLLDSAPHAWLFEYMAAVVHHGGAGSTAAGLRAGKPSILIPHMQDQFFWGRQVAALGVGPRPIPRSVLTAERLAQAVQDARQPSMRQRADRLGQQLRAEDGLACARDVLQRLNHSI